MEPAAGPPQLLGLHRVTLLGWVGQVAGGSGASKGVWSEWAGLANSAGAATGALYVHDDGPNKRCYVNCWVHEREKEERERERQREAVLLVVAVE